MSKIARFFKNNIYTIVFVSIISLPLIQMTTGIIKLDSSIEKRNKAALPDISSYSDFSQYFSDYETYFNDNFGFRSDLIALNGRIDYSIFNQSSNDDVIIGKNNYLYFKDEMADYHKTNLLSREQIELIAKKLKVFQEELAKRDISFIFSIAPNKSTIYPEYVKEASKNPNAESNLDMLLKALDSNKVNQINLKKLMLDNKDTYELYYLRDTHWNKIASNLAANEYLKKLNSIYGSNHSLGSENIRKGIYQGDLDNLLGFYTKTPEILADDVLTVSEDKLPKAISYGDSFGGPMFAPISYAFEQNVLAHTANSPLASNFTQLSTNAKIVNFEIVERNIANLIDYDFNIFDEDTTLIDEHYNKQILDIRQTNTANIQLTNLSHIENDDSVYLSTTAQTGYFDINNVNKNSEKIDFIYLETENNNSFIPTYFNFSDKNEFETINSNIGLMLKPQKNKYILDLRAENITTSNIHLQIGEKINSDVIIKEISLYTRENLK